jgi:hypothetical protein
MLWFRLVYIVDRSLQRWRCRGRRSRHSLFRAMPTPPLCTNQCNRIWWSCLIYVVNQVHFGQCSGWSSCYWSRISRCAFVDDLDCFLLFDSLPTCSCGFLLLQSFCGELTTRRTQLCGGHGVQWAKNDMPWQRQTKCERSSLPFGGFPFGLRCYWKLLHFFCCFPYWEGRGTL